MKLLLHLAASLAAIVLIPRPAGAQSTVGNLTCFRISDPMSKAKFQVTLGSDAAYNLKGKEGSHGRAL